MERIANTVDEETYGPFTYLDTAIGYLVHLDHLDAKNFGAQHLDSVISHLEYLDDAFGDFQHLEPKTYCAHNLDFVLGYPDYLDSVIGYPEHLSRAWNAFRHVLDPRNHEAHHQEH